MLAPTNRPLQEVVGGQWNSQLHMSRSEPQSQRQSGSSSVDSRPPPAKRVHLQPPLASYPMPHPQSNSTVNTEVKLLVTQFTDYIKMIYRDNAVERDTKWPPTPSKVFINLVCIDRKSVHSKIEVTETMVRHGDVDVIRGKKWPIDINQIATHLPGGALEKVILVEGAPGVGKSTFAWEFCRRWERGEIAQQYQLVLLLRLRDDRMSRAKSLDDLIFHREKVCQAVRIHSWS